MYVFANTTKECIQRNVSPQIWIPGALVEFPLVNASHFRYARLKYRLRYASRLELKAYRGRSIINSHRILLLFMFKPFLPLYNYKKYDFILNQYQLQILHYWDLRIWVKKGFQRKGWRVQQWWNWWECAVRPINTSPYKPYTISVKELLCKMCEYTYI